MEWRQASFRQQLLAAFLAMAMVPALLLALITYIEARHEVAVNLAELQAQNLQAAISARNYLAAAVAAGQRVVRVLSTEPRLVTRPTPVDRQQLRHLLADVPLGYNVVVLDRQGRPTVDAKGLVTAATGDVHRLYPAYASLLHRHGLIAGGALQLKGGGGPGLVLGQVIRRPDGGAVGMAVVTLTLRPYREQLTGIAAVGSAPSLYVTDQTGRLVFGAGAKAPAVTLQDVGDDPAFLAAQGRTSGTVGPYRSALAAHELTGAFAVVAATGWVVVVASDAEAVWRDAMGSVVSALMMLGPAALLALLAAYGLSRRYARPVTDLVGMVRGLPAGAPVVPPASARSANEFEILATAIAETSQTLAHNAAALEQGRRTLARQLDERTRSLVATNRIVRALAAAHDLPRAFQAILPQLEDLLDADGSMISRYDATRQELVPTAFHIPGVARPAGRSLAHSAEGRALRHGEAWVDASLSADSPAADALGLARAGYRGRITLPIRARSGRLVGAVTFVCRHAEAYDRDDGDRLEPIVEQLAMAIDRDQLLQEMGRRREQAETLAALATTFARSVRFEEVVGTVLRGLQGTSGIARVQLWLLDDDGAAARCVAAEGPLAQEAVGVCIPLAPATIHSRRAVRLAAGQPVVLTSRAAMAFDPDLLDRHDIHAGIFVPLIAGGRLFGAIFLVNAVDVSADWMAAIQAVVAQAAPAIANAQLFAQLEQRRHDAETLVRVAGALSTSLRLDDLAPVLLEAMRSAFVTDHATLWLVDDDREVATCVAGVGPRAEEAVGMVSRRSEVPDIPERVRRGQPVLVSHVDRSPAAVIPIMARFGVRAAAFFPLRASGSFVGFVLLTYEQAGRTFPEDRLDFGLAMASQAASAVANARLFGRLETALVHLQSVQEQLIRSERLSALGQLSSFVSHEIKNRFNVITTAASLADMLAGRPDSGDRIKQTMATIKKEVDRGNDLMLRLLRFARPPEPSRELVSVQAILDAALLTARRANVRIVRQLPDSLPPVPGDPAHLEQVFLNLILNALQAMPNGGTLTVAATRQGPCIEVRIHDTGSGMSPEIQAHLFQPFFTTKPQGTGLGLVISQQIVDQHHGSIACESRPGDGTTFIIRLPAATAPAAAETGPPPAGPGNQAA